MKTIHVEVKGITTLIMHSTRSVNPLDPLTIELKSYTSKRKKTEDDYRKTSDLEWTLSLYWDDNIGLYMPAENIEACVREGAKNNRKGTEIAKAFNVVDMKNPIDIGENLTKEQMFTDFRFRDVRCMRVSTDRIMRTRARFDMWKFDFTATYDETITNLKTIINALEYAGKNVGLCDSRPKYGQFVCKVTELD